jgi:predicted DNA-binding transcriptional regulator AlpA
MTTTIEPLMTIDDVVGLLGGVSARSVYRHARSGKIPGAVWIGSAVRLRPAIIRAWLEGADFEPGKVLPMKRRA